MTRGRQSEGTLFPAGHVTAFNRVESITNL